MSNLKSRIITIEKKTQVEDTGLTPFCLIVDEGEDGKQYYTDKGGISHEYIPESYKGKKPRFLVFLKNYQSDKGGMNVRVKKQD